MTISENAFAARVQEIAARVEQLFDIAHREAKGKGKRFAKVPLIDDHFCKEETAFYQSRVVAAMTAVLWLERQKKPDWVPPLPLLRKDIDELKESKCPPAQLIGLFASSLMFQAWNWQQGHPPGLVDDDLMWRTPEQIAKQQQRGGRHHA